MKLVKVGKLIHIAEVPWFWFGLKGRAACHTRSSGTGKVFEATPDHISCGRCKRAYGSLVKRVTDTLQPDHEGVVPISYYAGHETLDKTVTVLNKREVTSFNVDAEVDALVPKNKERS